MGIPWKTWWRQRCEKLQSHPQHPGNEDDEPWPTAATAPALRGAGAPRAAGVSWDDGFEARLADPPAEGVVSPLVAAGREVSETFAWAPVDNWEPEAATPAARGVGLPRSEEQRLEELAAAGRNPFAGILPEDIEWADNPQGGWIVEEPRVTPPPAEGVLTPRAAGEPMASDFDFGQGAREGSEETAARGMGTPRGEQERLALLRAGEEDEWARTQNPDDIRRQIPDGEGVLGAGPREDDTFAENFGWEGEPGDEWGPEERTAPPGRGAGAPVPPRVRHQQQRLPMTAYELELLQNMVRF